MDWFEVNLIEPHRFARGPASSGGTRGVSWFKDSAAAHVRKAYEVRALLREASVEVEVLTTKRPGYVVYEDEVQVVAEPFSDTKA